MLVPPSITETAHFLFLTTNDPEFQVEGHEVPVTLSENRNIHYYHLTIYLYLILYYIKIRKEITDILQRI